MRKTGKTGKSNRMRQEASYMAAKEQLTAMEMIWGFMSGTTGHMGKTDFAPQKEAVRGFCISGNVFSARGAGERGHLIGKADADAS